MLAPRPEAAARARLTSDPQFRRFWFARLTSLTAGSISFVAFPVLVYALTDSGLWVSSAVAVQGIPYLLFGLLAGAMGDRFDRRTLMVGSEAIHAALLASIPIAHVAGHLSPEHVVAVALASRTVFVVYDAANLGALPTLVGPDDLPAAQSLLFGTSSAIELGVPGLAGLALTRIDPALMFAGAALLTGASALMTAAVSRPMSEIRTITGRLRDQVAGGAGWLWRNHDVRAQTLIATAQVFGQGVLVAHLVTWADLHLKVAADSPVVGILFGAWAAGGLAATLVVPAIIRRFGEPRTALLFGPLPAAGALACALAGSWPVAVVLVAGWGGTTMVVVLASVIHRQRRTPDALRSRINMTGRVVSYGIGFPLGGMLSGLAAAHFGVHAPFLLAAAVLAATAAAAWASGLRHGTRDVIEA